MVLNINLWCYPYTILDIVEVEVVFNVFGIETYREITQHKRYL